MTDKDQSNDKEFSHEETSPEERAEEKLLQDDEFTDLVSQQFNSQLNQGSDAVDQMAKKRSLDAIMNRIDRENKPGFFGSRLSIYAPAIAVAALAIFFVLPPLGDNDVQRTKGSQLLMEKIAVELTAYSLNDVGEQFNTDASPPKLGAAIIFSAHSSVRAMAQLVQLKKASVTVLGDVATLLPGEEKFFKSGVDYVGYKYQAEAGSFCVVARAEMESLERAVEDLIKQPENAQKESCKKI